jgi:DNA ligase-1
VSETLLHFALANDGAAATPKKLQKQSILADYLRLLSETDLSLAVRYAAGRPFAASDERVLNVGWSIVSDVILDMLKLEPHAYHELVVRSGEIGEALAIVWPTLHSDRPLTLEEIAAAFDELAARGGANFKRDILRELFSRCVHPREAAYLSKIIFREMRTGVREGLLLAAIAQAFDRPMADVQKGQLLVGDLDEVAVLAKNNALDVAQLRLFHPIQFMLASPQETAELAAETLGGRTFYCEDKLDGIRAQVHKSAGRIAIYTRTMDRTDESFPDVVAAIEQIPGDFLLDGEIVPYRDGQVRPFAHIQRRLGRKLLSPKVLRDNPATFIAFDLLYRNGQLLMDKPLAERRKALECLSLCSALLTTAAIHVQSTSQIEQAFEASRNRRNEGIILKDPESVYAPGRRGQWWLKLKTHLPTFDCVVTAAEYGHGKRRDVLSDYTFAVWDREPDMPGAELVNIGKAYSGLTDAEIAQLTELFLQLSRQQIGRVHRVEPKIVLEIACDQIQQSARHASGYALRFPRIKRIRWDKRPEDADRLNRLEEIYQSVPNFGRGLVSDNKTAEPTLFD